MPLGAIVQDSIRLDDLYRMISHIYTEQNAQRPASATFAHFVEVRNPHNAFKKEEARRRYLRGCAL